MARALSLTDKQQARFHHAAATEILDQIQDQEDRQILQSDLNSIELN